MLYNIFMDIFYALAEPRRRKIIELLASNGQLTATQICNKFDITAQAISQHLKILREAKLVVMEKRSQQRIYQMNPHSMLEVEKWTRQMEDLWSKRFDRLDKLLEEEKRKTRSKKGNKNGK